MWALPCAVASQLTEAVILRPGFRLGTGGYPARYYPASPDRNVRTSCLVITPAGLPSTSTTAAPAASSARAATLTGSPEPTDGSGGDISPATSSSGAAFPATSASSRSCSTIEPTTSAAITGGSALSTGSCDTSNSRRLAMTLRTVSVGCACTNAGSAEPALRSSTSPTRGSAVSAVRKP